MTEPGHIRIYPAKRLVRCGESADRIERRPPAGAMGISRQEPPRKTLHSLCYPPRDAPLRRSRRCPSFSAHKVNGTKRSPPPLPPLFLAVPAVPAYAAVVPALSRPPETRYLLIPRRKSSDADKESTQTARRQLPLQPFERSFPVAKKPRSTVLARRLCAETPAPQFAHLGPGIFAISCRAPRVVRGGSVGRPCAGCRAPGRAGPSPWLGRIGRDRWAARGRARNPVRRQSSRLDPKPPRRTGSTAAAPAGGRSSSTGPESWNSRAMRS